MTHRLAISLLLAVLFGAAPSIAQEITVQEAWPAFPPQLGKSAVEPGRIHITDDLLRSPEGAAALHEYVEAKKAGLYELGKGSVAADTIGQERDFNVQTNLQVDSLREWTTITFTLRSTNNVANVWVETSLDGTFSSQNMEELEAYILDATPEESYRPEHGIIANDNDTFGDPPNVDGDGRVDILLHDIIEGEGGGCCILGYVSSADLSLHPSSDGNRRDILYVDLPDGITHGGVGSIAGTIAHEYQHLIHFAYMDSPEISFVNEGLSEWAEIINGLFLRTINYLQDTTEHNTALLDFRRNESIAVTSNDYQRSGLFTTYLADRIGRVATGSIVQALAPNSSLYAVGAVGYDVVLQENGLALGDVIADFHAANYINDRAVDNRFGYSLPQRQTFVVAPTTTLDGASQTSASTSASVRAGAVHYVRWSNVADLQLEIAEGFWDEGDPRDATRFRLFTEPVEGPTEVIDLASDVVDHQVEGEFRRVTLIVANVDAESVTPVKYTISSEWSSGSGGFVEETISYDDGQIAAPVYIGNPSTMRQATKFDVPDGGRLEFVYVAPVWDNQFSTSELPSGLARDFTLYIWGDDGNGLPGSELFSMEVVEDPSASHVSDEGISFLAINVSTEAALTSLPGTIYIGLGNAGTDQNYLSLASSLSSSMDEVSYLYYPFGGVLSWSPFSNIQSNGEAILEGKVLPIRAQFLVATADENPHELPSTASLSQNYPNPFNPVTSIEFDLPQTGPVQLAVFDVLGRRVATLVDEVRQAGSHTSVVDATGWSSGPYFYTLQTQDRTLTRQMIVLK